MNLTFRKKLLFTFVVVLLFISYSIILIMINYNYQSLKKEFFIDAKNHASQADNNISNLFEQVKNNTKFLASSPNVNKADSSITALFNMNSDLTPKKYSKTIPGLESTIYNEFERYANTHLDTSFVYMGTIYGGFIRWPDGQIVNDFDPRKRDWYINSIKEPDKVVISKPYTLYNDPKFSIISVSTTIKDPNGKISGVLGMDISLDKLSEIISNLSVLNSGYMFLVNNDGTIIAHPNKKLNFKNLDILNTTGYFDLESNNYFKYIIKDYTDFISQNNGSFETIVDGKPSLVNLYPSSNTDWKIATVIPQNELIKNAASTTFFIIIAMVSIIAVAVIFIIVIIKKMTKPLSKLTNLFEEVGNGNFNVRSDINTSDEFKELGDSFNKMTAKLSLNREMEEKLKENETRLKLALESARIGTYELNIQDNLLIVDSMTAEILGFTQGEINPLDLNSALKYSHPDDITLIKGLIKKCITGELNFYQYEHRLKHKNGYWIWVNTRGAVIERDNHDNPIKILGTHIDITQRKKSEEIELLLKEKEKEEVIKNEFFANISHELKTPVNVIYSAIQLEANYISNLDINQILKYNNTIKQNCLRLIRLINNIIDLTRIETGFLKPEFKVENIVNLIENITMSVISYAEIKHIDVVFDTEYEELYVNCDANLIERIMLNLLSNSVKYGKENGLLEVNIYKDNEDFVTISIKDDGIGIPENLQRKVFERFQRVDKSMSRPTEGSGIGLSLVKSLLEIQQGTISLQSKLNEGTEFLIKLPISEKTSESCMINENYEIKSENHIIEKVHVEFSDIYR